MSNLDLTTDQDNQVIKLTVTKEHKELVEELKKTVEINPLLNITIDGNLQVQEQIGITIRFK